MHNPASNTPRRPRYQTRSCPRMLVKRSCHMFGSASHVQAVANATYGLDQMARVTKLAPHIGDVHLDVVLVSEEVIAPYTVQNELARQYLPRVAREQA